mgnify:CR=1 FL=1
MATPLMPKATAVWLVDNTKLSFDQIADFCGLHVLEVQGIADGEVATGIHGLDPVAAACKTHQGSALYAARQTPGQARRRCLVVAPSPGAFGCSDRQNDRHHQKHHSCGARAVTLEQCQHSPA